MRALLVFMCVFSGGFKGGEEVVGAASPYWPQHFFSKSLFSPYKACVVHCVHFVIYDNGADTLSSAPL